MKATKDLLLGFAAMLAAVAIALVSSMSSMSPALASTTVEVGVGGKVVGLVTDTMMTSTTRPPALAVEVGVGGKVAGFGRATVA